MARDMFGGGGTWYDGQAFHVPGAERAQREAQPFINPTYNRGGDRMKPLPPRPPRMGRLTRPRAPRPWHSSGYSVVRMKTKPPPQPRPKVDEVRESQALEVEQELRAIFKKHAPNMLTALPILMAKWQDREQILLNRIRGQYELAEKAQALEEAVIKEPPPQLPRIGHPHRELGWLEMRRPDDAGRAEDSTTTLEQHSKRTSIVEKIGHPGRELGWLEGRPRFLAEK
jgi:hypothetical protein